MNVVEFGVSVAFYMVVSCFAIGNIFLGSK